MVIMDRRERDAIIARFPKADIVKTKHRYFLIGAYSSEPMRLLLSMRGITPPPSRKDKARNRPN